MSEKEFVVSHPKARSPLTITGSTLEEALAKEGLDPAIWKEVVPLKPDEIPSPPDE